MAGKQKQRGNPDCVVPRTPSCSPGSDFSFFRNNFSPALLWQCVRKTSCFVHTSNGVKLTTEPYNLRAQHCEKYCGLSSAKPLSVAFHPTKKGNLCLIGKWNCRPTVWRKPKAQKKMINVSRNAVETSKKLRNALHAYKPTAMEDVKKVMNRMKRTMLLPKAAAIC